MCKVSKRVSTRKGRSSQSVPRSLKSSLDSEEDLVLVLRVSLEEASDELDVVEIVVTVSIEGSRRPEETTLVDGFTHACESNVVFNDTSACPSETHEAVGYTIGDDDVGCIAAQWAATDSVAWDIRCHGAIVTSS